MNAHERDYASTWAWFEGAQSRQEAISAPVIVLAEVAAAVSRGVGDMALACRVVKELQDSKIIDLLPVTSAMAERAAEIAAACPVRGCDAIYLALTEQLSDCLVTLDVQQLERGAEVVATRKPTG